MSRNQWWITGCIGAAGIILPFGVDSPVWMTVLNLFFYYAVLSISWNIVFGYAGLFSFGHVAFAAVGGYASSNGHPPRAFSFLGTFHRRLLLRGHRYCFGRDFPPGARVLLCLLTWAFAEVVNVVIKTEHQITGGTGGLITPGFFSEPKADFYSYFVGLGLFLLTFVFSLLLFHSRPGLYLFAVRDDLDAAETMGVNTQLWKVLGFACGGFSAGVAGAYCAHSLGLINPSIGGLDEMGKICLMVIVGGVGTIYGPILGTFFVVILSEIIRGSLAELNLLIFALVMILTMRFIPENSWESSDYSAPFRETIFQKCQKRLTAEKDLHLSRRAERGVVKRALGRRAKVVILNPSLTVDRGIQEVPKIVRLKNTPCPMQEELNRQTKSSTFTTHDLIYQRTGKERKKWVRHNTF